MKSFLRILALMGTVLIHAHAVESSSAPVVSVSTFSVEASTVQFSTWSWRTAPNTAFAIGEDLHFVVKWGVVVAGYSSLSVPAYDYINDRQAYHIVSKARSGGIVHTFYKVEDINEVWLDAQSLVTLRYEKRIKEGKYRIEESTFLDQVNHRWLTKAFRLDKNTFEQKEGDLPLDVLDSFGSLYYVRTLPLETGQSYTMSVHSGDKIYPLVVKVIKREKIKVPAGKFNTILVEPILRGPGIFVAKGKKLEVWLTDDERRTPVRMRSEVFIGHVSAELLPPKKDSAIPPEDASKI